MSNSIYPFKNLIFEGGGVKGMGCVGAMEVLDGKGISQNIRRVGGTSAGAINALLVRINYPVKLFDWEKYIEKADLPKNSVARDYYAKVNTELKNMGKDISPYAFNRETLGFRLDSKEEISLFRDHAEPPEHTDDFFAYTWGLIETIMEAQSSQHLHSDDWQRTIYIDTLGVKTTQFDLDE